MYLEMLVGSCDRCDVAAVRVLACVEELHTLNPANECISYKAAYSLSTVGTRTSRDGTGKTLTTQS